MSLMHGALTPAAATDSVNRVLSRSRHCIILFVGSCFKSPIALI